MRSAQAAMGAVTKTDAYHSVHGRHSAAAGGGQSAAGFNMRNASTVEVFLECHSVLDLLAVLVTSCANRIRAIEMWD